MFGWFIRTSQDSSLSSDKVHSRENSRDFTNSDRSSDFLYYSFDKQEQIEQKALEEGVTIAASLKSNYLSSNLFQRNQDENIPNINKSTHLFEEQDIVAEVVHVSKNTIQPFGCLCICFPKDDDHEDYDKYSKHYISKNPDLLKELIGEVCE